MIWNNTAQMGSQNVHCIGNLQPLWSSGLPSSSHSRCIPTPGTGSSRRKRCHPRSTGRPNKNTTHVLASCRRCKPKLPLGVRLARATSTTSLLGHTRTGEPPHRKSHATQYHSCPHTRTPGVTRHAVPQLPAHKDTGSHTPRSTTAAHTQGRRESHATQYHSCPAARGTCAARTRTYRRSHNSTRE